MSIHHMEIVLAFKFCHICLENEFEIVCEFAYIINVLTYLFHTYACCYLIQTPALFVRHLILAEELFLHIDKLYTISII